MKFSTIISTSFLPIFASASPVELNNRQDASCVRTKQSATFDDLTAVPLLAEASPVDIYMGLQYRAFDVLRRFFEVFCWLPLTDLFSSLEAGLPLGAAGDPPIGIPPPSSPNVAANSITGTLLRGNPALIASGIKSFDIDSTQFACTANTVVSVVGVPSPCTVSFTAFKRDETRSFDTFNADFDPNTGNFASVNFPEDWTDLREVDLALVNAPLTTTLTALFLDNVQYTTCL